MARRKGSRSKAVTVNNGRYKVWQTMRLLQKNGCGFVAADLAAAAETTLSSVQKYLQGLHRHGYLRVSREKMSGRRGGDRVFRLERDTGPSPPRLTRDGQLYDPNTGRTLPPLAAAAATTRSALSPAAGQEQADGARLD